MSWAGTLALRTLRRNPLRSLFMLLGVAVGIASLIAMASVGEATRQETLRQFKRMVGTFDTISIRPGSSRTRGMPSLTSVEPTLRFDDPEQYATAAAAIEALLRERHGIVPPVEAAFQQQLPPAFLWGAMVGAVALATLVGLVFGLQPAWRAANVDPIQALRT